VTAKPVFARDIPFGVTEFGAAVENTVAGPPFGGEVEQARGLVRLVLKGSAALIARALKLGEQREHPGRDPRAWRHLHHGGPCPGGRPGPRFGSANRFLSTLQTKLRPPARCADRRSFRRDQPPGRPAKPVRSSARRRAGRLVQLGPHNAMPSGPRVRAGSGGPSQNAVARGWMRVSGTFGSALHRVGPNICRISSA
jgi:hypothetical protein